MPVESRDAGGWVCTRGGLRLRCGFLQETPEGWRRPMLARPGDQVVLLVEARRPEGATGTRELTVELRRGERQRDVWTERVGPAGLRSAFRVRWGTSGSSRLIARLLVDGREAAGATLLLGAPLADAQGRFAPGAADGPASSATLLAYADELRRRVGEDDPQNHWG